MTKKGWAIVDARWVHSIKTRKKNQEIPAFNKYEEVRKEYCLNPHDQEIPTRSFKKIPKDASQKDQEAKWRQVDPCHRNQEAKSQLPTARKWSTRQARMQEPKAKRSRVPKKPNRGQGGDGADRAWWSRRRRRHRRSICRCSGQGRGQCWASSAAWRSCPEPRPAISQPPPFPPFLLPPSSGDSLTERPYRPNLQLIWRLHLPFFYVAASDFLYVK